MNYAACATEAFSERPLHRQERDSESGPYHFEARYLNSNLGRFLSPDSIVGVPKKSKTIADEVDFLCRLISRLALTLKGTKEGAVLLDPLRAQIRLS